MRVGVVIPFAPGREQNLAKVIVSLVQQTAGAPPIIAVCDGAEDAPRTVAWDGALVWIECRKHEPGLEQPRNVGTRVLRERFPDVTHVWFLDSDVFVGPGALDELYDAIAQGAEDRIVVAPYEWLPEGRRPRLHKDEDWGWYHRFKNDPRWPQFDRSPPDHVYFRDLSAGLACWSGNLIWPVERFTEVGGFWSELHHGRCEDGELGLRAVAMEVGISFAAAVRGWHLWHPRNQALAIERNKRDVPMLDARHPWLQGTDVFLTDRDGGAFDVRCPCGEVVHTNAWWEHAEMCAQTSTMNLPVA